MTSFKKVTRTASHLMLRLAVFAFLLSTFSLTGCDALDSNAEAERLAEPAPVQDPVADVLVADRERTALPASLFGDWYERRTDGSQAAKLSFHERGQDRLEVMCAHYALRVEVQGSSILFRVLEMSEAFCESFAPDPVLATLEAATHYRITREGTLELFGGTQTTPLLRFDRPGIR